MQASLWGGPGALWAGAGPRTDPALNELRVRSARGELSWEEYSQRVANLGYAPGPRPGAGAEAGPDQAPPGL